MTPAVACTIACIGAANEDRKATLAAPYRPATSNPIAVRTAPGGVARNVAEALARLGHRVELFSRVGADTAGSAIVRHLRAAGVGVAGVVRDAGHATGSYTAVLEPTGDLVCGLADMAIYDACGETWFDAVLPAARRCRVWCLDANLPAPTLHALAAAAPPDTRLLADPVSAAKAPRLATILPRLAAIFPDGAEAAALTGTPVTGPAPALAAARALHNLGVAEVFVSLGADGVAYAGDAGSHIYPAFKVGRVVDVTGAGDAFFAGYVYGLLSGGTLPIAYALAAASLVVQVDTAVPPDLSPAALQRRVIECWREPSPSL